MWFTRELLSNQHNTCKKEDLIKPETSMLDGINMFRRIQTLTQTMITYPIMFSFSNKIVCLRRQLIVNCREKENLKNNGLVIKMINKKCNNNKKKDLLIK